MRHLTLTLAKSSETAAAGRGSKAEGERQARYPLETGTEPGAKAAITPPALPKEVTNRDVQVSMKPGAGSQSCLPGTVLIRGEIEGSSDLTVEGRVDGPVNLGTHNLTIGPSGQVNGNIQAGNVTILGAVVGDVVATDKVEIADTGRLVGAICAPRVSFSEGAHFKGRVDMANGPAGVRRQGPARTELEVRAALTETAS